MSGGGILCRKAQLCCEGEGCSVGEQRCVRWGAVAGMGVRVRAPARAQGACVKPSAPPWFAVGPFSSPSETYQYYDLPFCQPDSKDNKLLTLGEVRRAGRARGAAAAPWHGGPRLRLRSRVCRQRCSSPTDPPSPVAGRRRQPHGGHALRPVLPRGQGEGDAVLPAPQQGRRQGVPHGARMPPRQR